MIVSELYIRPRRFKIPIDDDIEYFLNIYNGYKDLYQSVYNYTDVTDMNSAIIDKIFLDFDFDYEMNFLSNVRTVAKYLHDNDYLFYIRFSGSGFHIFILLDDKKELKNPKNAIKNYVNFLHNETNTESDPAVVGDIRRVARIPNSLNIKREDQYYCINLKYDELMGMTYEDIRLMAKQPREVQNNFINGHRLLDISEWDNFIYEEQYKENRNTYISAQTNIINDNIPPCIESLMKDPMLGNAGRMQVIIFFRELGYTEEEVEDILYKFLSEEKFNHAVYEENLVKYLFKKDYLFPTCNWQKNNGFCTNQDCEGHGLYY